MGTLRRVYPGQPFAPRAEEWNAFIDAAEDFKSRQGLATTAPARGPVPPGVVRLIHNTSATDVDRFGILAVTGLVYDAAANLREFQSNWALTGIVPTDPTNQIAIAQEPIRAGKIGKALLQGFSPVQVDVVDEGDKFAAPIAADAAKLQSGGAGLAIAAKPAGTGVLWCLVHLGLGGGGMVTWAKVISCANDVATCKIYTGNWPTLTETAREVQAAMGEGLYGRDDFVVISQVAGGGNVPWIVTAGQPRWKFFVAPADGELAPLEFQDNPAEVDPCAEA